MHLHIVQHARAGVGPALAHAGMGPARVHAGLTPPKCKVKYPFQPCPRRRVNLLTQPKKKTRHSPAFTIKEYNEYVVTEQIVRKPPKQLSYIKPWNWQNKLRTNLKIATTWPAKTENENSKRRRRVVPNKVWYEAQTCLATHLFHWSSAQTRRGEKKSAH